MLNRGLSPRRPGVRDAPATPHDSPVRGGGGGGGGGEEEKEGGGGEKNPNSSLERSGESVPVHFCTPQTRPMGLGLGLGLGLGRGPGPVPASCTPGCGDQIPFAGSIADLAFVAEVRDAGPPGFADDIDFCVNAA